MHQDTPLRRPQTGKSDNPIRLDQAGDSRAIAQYASVIGNEFSVDTLLSVTGLLAGTGDGMGAGAAGPQIMLSTDGVPEMIGYQGVLTDTTGVPVDTVVNIPSSARISS